MKTRLIWLLSLLILALTFSLFIHKEASANPLPQNSTPTAYDIIEAVNALRIANGLLPLNPHPVLMEVAEWEANAIAGGAPGHTRPAGLTLGQWLISLGYPLAGDLSLDGYRSENWVAARTVEEAMSFWLGDAPHTNTMLSVYRSDIGAAIAVSDQTYIVLETALQTGSGQMQYDAYPILTAIPQNVNGIDLSIPQYIVPVARSTARPDGYVTHKVQYGQSLWSIAITYNSHIAQIRAWNNLDESDTIYEGQVLLVQINATQPPPATNTPLATETPYPTSTPTLQASLPTAAVQSSTTPIKSESSSSQTISPGIWVGFIVTLALVAGVFGTWATARKHE